MPTYNPIYWGHANPDFIPANPPAVSASPDPNRRDAVLHPSETTAHWRGMKPRWSYSHSTGELESPFMMERIEPAEVNRILSIARENHGKDKVKAIVLHLDPECVDAQYTELVHYKFERSEHREKKIPQLCFVGPAKRWKD